MAVVSNGLVKNACVFADRESSTDEIKKMRMERMAESTTVRP